jgi:hypothetical protein
MVTASAFPLEKNLALPITVESGELAAHLGVVAKKGTLTPPHNWIPIVYVVFSPRLSFPGFLCAYSNVGHIEFLPELDFFRSLYCNVRFLATEGMKVPLTYVIVGFLIFGTFAELRKAAITFVMSVRPSAWNNSVPTGRIFIKFAI